VPATCTPMIRACSMFLRTCSTRLDAPRRRSVSSADTARPGATTTCGRIPQALLSIACIWKPKRSISACPEHPPRSSAMQRSHSDAAAWATTPNRISSTWTWDAYAAGNSCAVAMKRSGVADLPLHGGRVPRWLAERMTKLGTAITENIIHDYGTSAFLSRLSDPFWFQAFGSVMGMDWHSSGVTTSVMGALKRGLAPRADELGIYVCGGRGRSSRNTPQELRALSERKGFDGEELVRTSRLTARIDNNAIADGFQIYLHSFVV